MFLPTTFPSHSSTLEITSNPRLPPLPHPSFLSLTTSCHPGLFCFPNKAKDTLSREGHTFLFFPENALSFFYVLISTLGCSSMSSDYLLWAPTNIMLPLSAIVIPLFSDLAMYSGTSLAPNLIPSPSSLLQTQISFSTSTLFIPSALYPPPSSKLLPTYCG